MVSYFIYLYIFCAFNHGLCGLFFLFGIWWFFKEIRISNTIVVNKKKKKKKKIFVFIIQVFILIIYFCYALRYKLDDDNRMEIPNSIDKKILGYFSKDNVR